MMKYRLDTIREAGVDKENIMHKAHLNLVYICNNL